MGVGSKRQGLVENSRGGFKMVGVGSKWWGLVENVTWHVGDHWGNALAEMRATSASIQTARVRCKQLMILSKDNKDYT